MHAAPDRQVQSFNFPEVFRPYDETDGWDYEKDICGRPLLPRRSWKLVRDLQGRHEESSFVVMQPSQCIFYAGPFGDDPVDRLFSGFMVKQT
ncbi:hypothetical protein BDW75DRAFT_210245, partial [Aspergillus navahoensis]